MTDTSPNWGKWVTHFDSIGQAPTMNIVFNPLSTIATILFDRMVLSLTDSSQYNLAGSIGLAGYFPIVLPDEFPLAGYLLIVRGTVITSPDASAILTGSIGEKTFAQEWPRTGKIVEIGRDGKPESNQLETRDFIATCFSGDQHLAIGDPPKFPPAFPLTISLSMQARRRSVGDAAEMHIDSLDIVMLR